MRLRVHSDVWHGVRYWGYEVYDPAAPAGRQCRQSGHGRRTWVEALADGGSALKHMTGKMTVSQRVSEFDQRRSHTV